MKIQGITLAALMLLMQPIIAMQSQSQQTSAWQQLYQYLANKMQSVKTYWSTQQLPTAYAPQPLPTAQPQPSAPPLEQPMRMPAVTADATRWNTSAQFKAAYSKLVFLNRFPPVNRIAAAGLLLNIQNTLKPAMHRNLWGLTDAAKALWTSYNSDTLGLVLDHFISAENLSWIAYCQIMYSNAGNPFTYTNKEIPGILNPFAFQYQPPHEPNPDQLPTPYYDVTVYSLLNTLIDNIDAVNNEVVNVRFGKDQKQINYFKQKLSTLQRNLETVLSSFKGHHPNQVTPFRQDWDAMISILTQEFNEGNLELAYKLFELTTPYFLKK